MFQLFARHLTHSKGWILRHAVEMTGISLTCQNACGLGSAEPIEADVCISGFSIYPLTARLQCWLNLQFTSSRISTSSDFVSSVYRRSEMLQNRNCDPFINVAFE